jgi:hypothetical protein
VQHWLLHRRGPAVLCPYVPCGLTWRQIANSVNNQHPFSACVPGLGDPKLAVCDGAGGNDFVSASNWTCNQGYVVAPAPDYCSRMSAAVQQCRHTRAINK